MDIVTRAVVSALVIVAITTMAQRNATLAGGLASLPLVTVLAIAWLSVDQQGNGQIARLLTGVLWGLAPTAGLLAVTAGLLIRGVHLSVAFMAGLAVRVLCIFATRQVGLLGP